MEPARPHVPLVLLGGSAGALRPLQRILGSLPPDLPAAVCVVIHLPDDSTSGLARVLSRSGPLETAFAEDGERIEPSRVRVAPPSHHLLVRDGRLHLSRGARENGSRPAIDPLFRSAATAAGGRVVSVLLSGTLDDGAAGSTWVVQAGGRTLAQDPDEADFPDMPRSAITRGAIAEVLPHDAIGQRIQELVSVMNETPDDHASRQPLDVSADAPAADPEADPVERGLDGPATDLPEPASPYSCPACGGVLHRRAQPDQFVCRVGHRYSPDALAHGQEDIVEEALWTALRTLEDAASLAQRVLDRAAARGDEAMVGRFETRRATAEARAARIRGLLRSTAPHPAEELGADDELGAAAEPASSRAGAA